MIILNVNEIYGDHTKKIYNALSNMFTLPQKNVYLQMINKRMKDNG